MIRAIRKLTRLANLDEVARFAIDIIEAWNNLAKDRFLNRQTITTTLASGDNTILHTLGYEPAGYVIVNRSAAISHYLVSKTSSQIILNVSAAATVTLEVY